MSDRQGGTLGPFLLGIAVGAALGALFAPDTGEGTRRQLRRKLRGLRDLAEDKAEELKALVGGEDDDEDLDDEDLDDEAPADEEEAVIDRPAETRSARAELEHRLAEARRRRRQASRVRGSEEEDEPVT